MKPVHIGMHGNREKKTAGPMNGRMRVGAAKPMHTMHEKVTRVGLQIAIAMHGHVSPNCLVMPMHTTYTQATLAVTGGVYAMRAGNLMGRL